MSKSAPAEKMTPLRRRMRYAARKVLLAAGVVAAAAVLVLADRAGLFGRSDFAKYEGRSAKVVKVVDGDTLDVDITDGGHRHTRIRLWGVDTPETVKPNTPPQHFGRQAGKFTAAAAMGKTVRLELDPRQTRDKYNRLLAYVHLPDGRMLNRTLIARGCGYADPRFEHRYKDEFRLLQDQARKAQAGLWKEVRAEQLPFYYIGRIKLPER